jgi:tRNA pseudouridine55 synthase
MAMAEELLLIDKPSGITSMDVIRRLRKKLNIRKIGHAGTLDPLATGLLLVGVGAGTKQLTDLVGLDKEYVAEVRIGESRTTGDLEGEVTATKDASSLTEGQVEQCVTEMIGTHTLPVSAYSAIKKDGVPMYKRARQAEKRGVVVTDVPVREMTVHGAELLDFTPGQPAVATVRLAVSSGTYIRSLAEEIGRRLGYPATLQFLRRTKIGEYLVEEAETI